MDREPEGGSDVGRDYERDLGDEPPATLRDAAPDYLAPIDASAPVSGHSPAPTSATSLAETPEQVVVAEGQGPAARDAAGRIPDADAHRAGAFSRPRLPVEAARRPVWPRVVVPLELPEADRMRAGRERAPEG